MDLQSLQRAVQGGQTFEYSFFWGHTPKEIDCVDASCLSQWFPASFVVDGCVYPTAEHWMMAGKARLFADGEALEKILATPDPSRAKAIGREVRGFDSDRWSSCCVALVVDGNIEKFAQNEPLRSFLLATKDRVLVEASPRDRIWGIGMAASNEAALDPRRWRGKNLLGFALMEVRARLSVGSR